MIAGGAMRNLLSGYLVAVLIAVCAIVAAYLFVARSKADGGVKAATIVGAAIVAGVCFELVSLVV